MKKLNLLKKKRQPLYLAEALYEKCMAKLLSNPDITTDDAKKLLSGMVEQAGGIKDLSFEKFNTLFTGTLEAMGISTKEEDSMDEKKSKLSVLKDRVKGIKVKAPSAETGTKVGKAASYVAKPVVKVYDVLTKPFGELVNGFKEGWKDG